MSLRSNLKFKYRGKDLEIACRQKRIHHLDRLKAWRADLELAKATFKDASVDFREYPVTGGTRLQAVIDPTAQQRLDECQSKVTEHGGKADEYERWERGFKANDTYYFEIDPDDIAFFGL